MPEQIKYWWVVFGFCLTMSLAAQSDCDQSILDAERAYYTGRFDQVPKLLSACLKFGFSKDQKAEAYRILSLSYIFSRDFVLADSALLNMFQINPQYEFTAQDPPEFKKRAQNIIIHPLVEVSVYAGRIQPRFQITQVYDTRVLPATATYEGKKGNHFGISLSYYLNKKISVRGGYELQSYSFTIEDANALNTSLLTETQKRKQWLAAVGYRFEKISLQTYIGAIFSTLRKADAYLVMDRAQGSGEIDFSFNNLPQRTKNELRPFAEVIINLPMARGWFINLNSRFELGLANITNSKNRYTKLEHNVQFEWVEDDFKARYSIFGIGISKQLYKVKMK